MDSGKIDNVSAGTFSGYSVMDDSQSDSIMTQEYSQSISDEQVSEYLEKCQILTSEYVAHNFSPFWADWINSIEKREENARSNKEQVALADVVQQLKSFANMAEKRFSERLGAGFAQFCDKTLNAPATEQFRPDRLSLVENAELEEAIAITSICYRADSKQNELLWVLHQRLSLLNGGKKIDERGNPASPIQFCEALRNVMSDLGFDIKIKVLGYKNFELMLIKSLEDLYEGLNTYLAGVGILPNLDRTKRAKSTLSNHHAIADTQELSASENLEAEHQHRRASDGLLQGEESQGAGKYQQGLISAIRLLQSHISQEGIQPTDEKVTPSQSAPVNLSGELLPAIGSGANTTLADSLQLMGAVSILQNKAVTVARTLENAEMAQVQPVDVAAASQQIVTQLQKEGDGSIRSDDMHTIGLVGLLFEYMLSDERLPDSVKALLSFLHTPFLKIAFIDKDFFEKTDHPARVLLNCIAEAGSRWVSNDGSSQYNMYAKIKTTVFHLLENFVNDVKIFAEALLEFNAYTHNVARRQELMEKRALEKAQGEEKLREAKLLVNNEIQLRIKEQELPSAVLLLLLLPWSDYLSFIILRYGSESDSCRQALNVVDGVLWSIEPKTTQEDKTRQLDMQDKLMRSLEAGFETIGYEQAKARKLLDAIISLQKMALQSLKVEPAPAPMRDKLESIAAEKAGDTTSSQQNMTDEEAQLVEKLKLLEFGTWLENKEGRRFKVAWYNHKTMHYMLVDQQGRKVSMMSALQLAKDMIASEIKVVAGSAKPFFERALENIYQRLNTQASGELLEESEGVANE